MKKEIKCKAAVNGTVYEVRIARTSKKYDLYVDGEHCSELWLNRIEENQEKDVVIGGKRCQFVLYDDEPDLSVDGILQFAQWEQEKTQRFHKRAAFFGGLVMILVGLYATFVWVALTLSGVGPLFGKVGLVMIILFTLSMLPYKPLLNHLFL